MGNNGNGKSTSNGTTAKSLEQINEEAYQSYVKFIKMEEYGFDDLHDKIMALKYYCNNNGLELQKIDDNWFTDGNMIVIKDPNGFTYSFDTSVIYGRNGFSTYELLTNIDFTKTIVDKIPSAYKDEVNKVVFKYKKGALGYFHGDVSTSSQIYLTPSAFKPEKQWETGLTGTIIHEMAHAYDFNHGGVFRCGGMTNFSKMSSYPTGYAKDPDYVNKYGEHFESISTICEMVYTGKVRNDALMKNGDNIYTAFYKKYGRRPDWSDKSDNKKAYKIWEKDWSEPVDLAKKMMETPSYILSIDNEFIY